MVEPIVSKADLELRIQEKLDIIAVLFEHKSNQYSTGSAFANFGVGAKLRYGECGYKAMYEALKDYMGKHIAYIYTHDLGAGSTKESLQDIAVYCLIASVMSDLDEEAVEFEKRNEKATVPDNADIPY